MSEGLHDASDGNLARGFSDGDAEALVSLESLMSVRAGADGWA
jgi:hypothetical protein